MWWSIWFGSSDPTIEVKIPDPQEICPHVWQDISEVGEAVTQKCVRCSKERTINIPK
jgi:hypothetical protein